MRIKITLFILLFAILHACTSEEKQEFTAIKDKINCANSTLLISENDSIVDTESAKPITWKGSYNDNSVEINFIKTISTDNETEKLSFVFKKVDSCLKIERIYKYYDGNLVAISAITEMEILDFAIQDWEVNKLFSGSVTYQDHHDKKVYTRKFWVTFSSDDYVENTNDFTLFSNCFASKLPIDIDMNADNLIDYKLIYEKILNKGNNPSYTEYAIKLISTDPDINYILSPRASKSPYSIVFEAPFSSENTHQYMSEMKNTLDIFYEFEAPYQKYNHFLNNKLTYKNEFSNDKEDYFVVRINFGDKKFYGWIKFNLNVANCELEIIETYLNPIETKHISVTL